MYHVQINSYLSLSELLELEEDLAFLLLPLLDDETPLRPRFFFAESKSSPKVVMYSTLPFFFAASGLGDLLLSSSLLEWYRRLGFRSWKVA